MIYLGSDYFEQFFKNWQKESDSQKPFLYGMQDLTPGDIIDPLEGSTYDDELDEKAFEARSLKFADCYVERIFPLAIDFYPQFRKKKVMLKEAMHEKGRDIYSNMCDVQDDYFESPSNVPVEDSASWDLCLDDITSFVHNRTLDHLLENYDAWFKRKISYENIYVESFYACAYVKLVQKVLADMLYEFFPAMNCLSPKQRCVANASLLMESYETYDILASLDPDGLNKSYILSDLEDYDFEDLLFWKGPEFERNKKGKIIFMLIPKNFPRPDQVPVLCSQCKKFYDTKVLNQLCTVNRFDQRNSESFKCRAFEKKNHDSKV
ncbi:MAG TPA: hypothetical protein VIH57_03510 [Bacteroidales bacterium]